MFIFVKSSCARCLVVLQYRVHDGKFTSRETASVMVEVVAEAEACSNPQTGLGGACRF